MTIRNNICLLAIVAGLSTAGCASTHTDATEHRESRAPAYSTVKAGSLDAKILDDVIDATYWIPGRDVRRGMRVQNFTRSVALQECDADPIAMDSTTDRYAQDLFPDLDLIRRRGLSEGGPSYLDDLSKDCVELTPDGLASWAAWYQLQPEWQDLATDVQHEMSRDSEALQMVDCLRTRTGLTFDGRDPTTNFLVAVNDAGIAGASHDRMSAYAAAYADCGRSYFAAFANELTARRAGMVERHRPTLLRFAVDIAEAGYVP